MVVHVGLPGGTIPQFCMYVCMYVCTCMLLGPSGCLDMRFRDLWPGMKGSGFQAQGQGVRREYQHKAGCNLPKPTITNIMVADS